jgi:hypothetical protein
VLAVGTVAVVVVALFRLGQPSVVAAGGGCTAHTSCTRVLFLGDSLTFVNDLPTTFADLAWAGGHHVDAQTLSSGGETLAGHVADPNTATTIASTRWNTVVLQDQSENPSLPYYRQNEMFPAATQLVAMIRDDGAQPLLFLTWAHQNGWPQADLDDYASMQAAVDQGYLDLAHHPRRPCYARWGCLAESRVRQCECRPLARRRCAPHRGGDVPGGLCLLRLYLQTESGGALVSKRLVEF